MPVFDESKMIDVPRPPVTEKAMLVRVALPGDSELEVEDSLEELRQLAWTAGAEIVLTIVQHRDRPNPATLVGAGKLEEMKAAVQEMGIEVAIFDSDLTAAQGSKLEKVLEVKVVDRTQLILDIFAQRAQTREGRKQVELAQLQYLLPRLAGRGSVMRQQGGIGVRGPGEQKLEVDRRVIRYRIGLLKEELEEVRQDRRIQRKRRNEAGTPRVALVGYTNAGKSSLLNALTAAGALAEDKLFATLDPLVRRCTLPGGGEVLLADTVGFVRRLPHTLVAAFRATLEAVNESDLLLLVADAAHPTMEEHIRTVRQVLEEIGASTVPIIRVYNKTDLLEREEIEGLLSGRDPSVAVSAREGTGLDTLLQAVANHIGATRTRLRLRIPQDKAAVLARVHDGGRVISTTYEDNDILLEVEVNASSAGALAPYTVPES
jgi:GTP-binding protein HflX